MVRVEPLGGRGGEDRPSQEQLQAKLQKVSAPCFGVALLANKAICAWGCQLGVLQDLVFRLNRNAADTAGIMPQDKIPFVVTNGVRVAFFAVFTAVTGIDFIEYADPFKTFNPSHLGIAGPVTVAVLLVS